MSAEIPKRIYVLEDHSGNTMLVPEQISEAEAFEKITQGYEVTIHTYVLQPARLVSRKETP